MTLDVRRLGPDDPEAVTAASRALGAEAFGTMPPGATPPPMPAPGSWPDGVGMWATFDAADPDPADGSPRMVARVRTHDYTSWWGGAAVPTCGLAGVVVAAEHRGCGHLAELLRRSLGEAAAAGAAVSTLFPTAPGIYRGFGYELATSFDTVELPAAELAGVRPAPSVTVRRARPGDLPALTAAYDAWASQQNGPLTRRGPLFAEETLLDDVTGVSLVETDGPDGPRVVGYAAWQRGTGYGADRVLEVEDLVALTPDAARALWRLIGSFSSVTGRVRLHTSDPDTARLVLPSLAWQRVESHPYMLRLLDVPGALVPRTFAVDGEATFAVTGDRLGLVDGTWRLRVADGVAEVEATTSTTAPVLTVAGLSLLYAGAQGPANLRVAGHLEGPTTHDALLAAWFGGRQVHVRDYF
ncbi:GNAT family N-acetyltransferase [Nocardioides sp. ChNu-153]|uniref:GNAT family N-acetyltransferase n=1 Tax=Nocardioides sp. ChNu-153 TaxID=2779364 RepID=UPI00264E1D0E|nr:GNAT family N-acetyltransferase [Nocardioides sp. ChNu-153]MDN7120248.1 GNAT family N-acetyltransferase [Nocardioides sp. ChNu-153]